VSADSETMTANGVDVPGLFATIETVRARRELAEFRFRATNRWVIGTHSRTTIESFSGAGAEHSHVKEYAYEADHPEVLVGADQAPTPVEFLLHALGACLMAGVANVASARGVALRSVEASIEGDIDLQGILGLSDTVRNGFEDIRATFRVKGDAPDEMLRKVVAQAVARSAVFDVLKHGVPVSIQTEC
jgi:uncharacterized OsmC-like protein